MMHQTMRRKPVHDASLARKVASPLLPAVLIHRTALVEQLQKAIVPALHENGAHSRYKLVLCCAPAGYGKTTLLADFAVSTALPCCWYFLDQADTDPVVFFRTLLASIRQTFPQFGTSLDLGFYTLHSDDPSSALNSYYATLDTFCATLATEISEHFALILSNYEEINESDTLTNLVNYLLKQLPPQVTLIIESRVIPDISFTSFVIHDALYGLDTDALRFSAPDIAELAILQGLPPLTDAEAEHLVTSFDGWIAGILLGTRIGDARLRLLTQSAFRSEYSSPYQVKSLAEHKRKTLFTYMVDDVLKQNTSIYPFLQSVSILQHIEPALCNALLGITDASERLARLERLGLFLTSYESTSGITYICHPVIRDLLSEQLRKLEPDRFNALHRQAIALWHTNHNNEQAIYHALEISAYDVLIPLILDASEGLLQQGQRETLIRWLHALPTSFLESHPRLLLLQATIALEHGQHAVAFPLLAKAKTLVSDTVEAENLVVQAKIAILLSKAHFQVGEYPQAETLCHQVLQNMPKQEYALRADAALRLGICANLQGQFMSGIAYLQQALHTWGNQPPLKQAIDIHNALASTYYWVGNFLLAKHHLTSMQDACEQLQDVTEKGNSLILQGLILQDQGLAAEAEAAFLQALTLAHDTSHSQRGEAYALVNLGSLYLEQGQYTKALTFSQNGLALALEFGNRSLTNSALASEALSYLFLGDPVSAMLTIERMETQIQGESTVGYERVGRDLTYGMILLSQRRYQEATACFTSLEEVLHTTDLQRGIFQAKLRLAAGLVALDLQEKAVRLLEEVGLLLGAHRNFIHLVQVELQWLPLLLPVIQKHPHLAPLRVVLGLVDAPQEQNVLPATPDLEVSSPKLTIRAFGEPVVELDGQPIKHWRMSRAKELFFFLLDLDHTMSKETILTTLWPEYTERTNHIFHDTIYQLRKLLGEACVVFHPTGYCLDLPACYGEQIWYDVQVFRQQQTKAEQALAREHMELAKEAFLQMVQLYRGDYGRSFYNDWCTFRRDELRTAYLEARRQLAQMAWHAEAWNESADHWRQMLRYDNCLEEAHYGLIYCYMRQGKRNTALRQYQLCQKLLEEELGVQPNQALQKLYQRLTAKKSAE